MEVHNGSCFLTGGEYIRGKRHREEKGYREVERVLVRGVRWGRVGNEAHS